MPDDQRRRFDAKEAPHSRLFIIGSKSLEEADFKNAFDPFGTIEDIFVVKDRNTGENKGNNFFGFGRNIKRKSVILLKRYSLVYCLNSVMFPVYIFNIFSNNSINKCLI